MVIGGSTRTTHKKGQSPSQASVRRWGMIRHLLGIAQMFGATVSLILLFLTGVNPYTLTGVIITGVLTTSSVLLFGGRRSGKEENC